MLSGACLWGRRKVGGPQGGLLKPSSSQIQTTGAQKELKRERKGGSGGTLACSDRCPRPRVAMEAGRGKLLLGRSLS